MCRRRPGGAVIDVALLSTKHTRIRSNIFGSLVVRVLDFFCAFVCAPPPFFYSFRFLLTPVLEIPFLSRSSDLEILLLTPVLELFLLIPS